ncbi:MAG: NAD(P)/FAD-dependent oxidoreductase [Chitinophagaceae bacterium]|nr:NAD(P)/FAD-dependent oxidoreductase [Chitinophagaceae bacterium]
MEKKNYDAVVVGSGPNGLAAAITLQRAGLSVWLAESKSEIGGGMRTMELTLPGFKHDVCSAILPMALSSPFFRTLPLNEHGLEFVHPEIPAVHPFDDGTAGVLANSIETTAALLGEDHKSYTDLFQPILGYWPKIERDVLGPFPIPKYPVEMMKFGLKALPSAMSGAKRFSTKQARGLWAGMAAHSIQPLSNIATSAIALVLMVYAHRSGWPMAKGGSGSLAKALTDYFISLGGTVQTGFHVKSLDQLPSSRAVLFDVTPRQLLQIAGHKFSSLYSSQLKRYRYGAGIFKVDWALDAPAPFISEQARKAGTVHLGNTLEEIVAYEKGIWQNKVGEKPFVLFAQQSVFDKSRAPEGKHIAWAYCHVPNGYEGDMTKHIEAQVERFAPGFRERILAKHTFSPSSLEEYNNNYIGGDINGGVIDIRQLFTRPALRWSPYRTSTKGLYICSSSTPPGGGVHGLCGYHAAKRAMKDIFKIKR